MTQHLYETIKPLEILEGQLQSILNDVAFSPDFREAISDGLYACSLGEAALNVLVFNWSNEQLGTDKLSEEDKQYQEGVAFVEEQWHKITGMF
jgi:hypothetical protein